MTGELIPWWSSSDEDAKVIGAFVKALQAIEDVVKDRPVRAGPIKYDYADLAAVLDEVKPKLTEQGLALSQVPTEDGVMTTLYHTSGEWMSFAPLRITAAGSTPQMQGSAITYGRRYSLLAIMGMATEDDDGRAAAVHSTTAADGEMDPVHARIDNVARQIKDLTETDKAQLKDWADGRSLSNKALYENRDWLSEVEAFLDEGLGIREDDGDGDDEKEDTDEPES